MCRPRSRRALGDLSPMRRTPRASAFRLCGRIGVARSRSASSSRPCSRPARGSRSPNPVVPTASPRSSPPSPTPTRSCRTSARGSRPSRRASTRRSSTSRTRVTPPWQRSKRSTPVRPSLKDANAAIAAAQQRFDTFAASTYVNGPSASYVTATDPADIIDTAATGQTLAVSMPAGRSPTCSAPAPSRSTRSPPRGWPSRTPTRPSSTHSRARTPPSPALTQAQQTFGAQQAELDRLTAERAAAQAKLDQARAVVGARAARRACRAAPAAAPPAEPAEPVRGLGPRAGRAAAPGTEAGTAGWDTTLPAIPSAFVSGDPIAIINAVLGIALHLGAGSPSRWAAASCRSSGILPTPTGFTNGAIPRVYGRQASEYVIQRAGSQMGVPYSWGGGNAAGPSNGIDSGAGTVGFDCSGLILYALRRCRHQAAALLGLAVRHGPQDPVVADAPRRRDLLRPRRQPARHALPRQRPDARGAVHRLDTSRSRPVRTSGMTPYVIRYIEY